MKNTFGNQISLTIFGESHGAGVGAVLDGIPAGCPIDDAFLALCMDKRRARGDGISTARTEADEIQFLSGAYCNHTTGTPITMLIANQNTRSGDYAKTADLLRPGHADFTAYAKYFGAQDARGGGHFSGRITAALVGAGALCLSLLAAKGIHIETHIAACAGIEDIPFAADDAATLAAQVHALAQRAPDAFALNNPACADEMKQRIRAIGSEGDSVGGALETAIIGIPAGVGEPFFDSIESEIAHLAFSIPALKAISFGLGFDFASMRASEANDAFIMHDGEVRTKTNHNAGINGGISNGMPIVFRTAIKPTPSIYKPQQTVDYLSKQEATLTLSGRHDPCIVPRAAIVQSCAAALAVADLLTVRFGQGWMRPCDNNEVFTWNMD